MAGAMFPPPLKRKRQPENAQTSREKLPRQLQYDRKILNWKSTFMYKQYVNKKCSLFISEGGILLFFEDEDLYLSPSVCRVVDSGHLLSQ
jgi:hypothetical protein